MLSAINSNTCLANKVVSALQWEARFSPKPGLVDARSNGAHQDMDLTLFLRSAAVLQPTFQAMAQAGSEMPLDENLRTTIGKLGRQGEQTMYAATGGINTHKGAIWALGLLVTAAANQPQANWSQLLITAQSLAELPDTGLTANTPLTHGQQVRQKYALSGARGEALAGFPNIRRALQPVLKQQNQENWLRCLLTLCAHVDDTNIVHRSDLMTLANFQHQARAILKSPVAVLENEDYSALCQFALDHQISPGGSADLFAACYFLTNLSNSK